MDESKVGAPDEVEAQRLVATPTHHVERQQSWTGHGLHYAYDQEWGPIIHAVMGFNAPVPREKVEAVLSRKLLEYPRFASYISKDQCRWVPVSHVDLAHHIQEVTLPGDNPQAELEGLVSEVLPRRFKADAPLWEVLLVRYASASYDQATEAKADAEAEGTATAAGLEEGKAHHSRFDVVWRISHSIGDGITLATLLIDLCEPLGDAPHVRKRRRKKSPVWLTALTVFAVLVLAVVLPVLFCVATGPNYDDWLGMDEPLAEGWRVVIAAVWVLAILCMWGPSRRCLVAYGKVSMLPIGPADTNTLLKGGMTKRKAGKMSPNKKFASSEHRPILVANAKEVARWAAGARRQSSGPVPTMNDVLLAALGGGIRRYLELKHDPTVANSGKINMRAISIVNMRAVSGLAKDSKALLNDVKAARWGNDFSYFIIPLPCNHMRPADRIGFMSNTMSFIKRSPEAFFIREGTKTLYNTLGVKTAMSFNQHNLNKLECFMSNLAGPQMALKFAGVKLERLYNCTHPMEFGAGYSFLSYNGVATMCVACDSTLLPEPQLMVNCIMDEYFMYEQAAGVSQPTSSGPAPPIVALPNAAAAPPPADVQVPAVAVDVAAEDAENESKQASHTVSTRDVALSDGQV